MIADLMLFARPPALRLEPIDVASLADTVVAELQDQAAEQSTALVRSGSSEPLVACMDRTQIAVALRALIQNSLEAVRRGGRIDVAISDFRFQISDLEADRPKVPGSKLATGDRYTKRPHPPVPSPHFGQIENPPPANLKSEIRHLKLIVSDTGPGIPPEIRPHIFDPFYSGREAGRGLGLGLSKAWRVVTLHGGTLTVDSPTSGGARFSIELPMEAT
jgi:signal transduction histidine kinase